MGFLAALLVGLVAVEHLWFLILEMFLFRRPIGLNTFRLSQQAADTCATLAMNQGLYNGFLVAALVIALLRKSALMRRYGLGCVVTAGIYGAYSTGNPLLFFVQSGPALLALGLSEVSARRQQRNRGSSGNRN